MSNHIRMLREGWRNLCFVLLASFPAGPLQANCYFVAAEAGAECAIVDPGQNSASGIAEVINEHQLRPTAVLLTHGHFDHMWDAAQVADEYGVPVWIHPEDRHLLADPMAGVSNESAAMLRAQLGLSAEDVAGFAEPNQVRDAVSDTQIQVGQLTLHVDHFPGHTAGSVTYRVDYPGPEASQILFAGDFLFQGSIGRTDLAGGSHVQMMESLRRALDFDDDIVVLPGHGPQTSIGRERATNPFMAELLS